MVDQGAGGMKGEGDMRREGQAAPGGPGPAQLRRQLSWPVPAWLDFGAAIAWRALLVVAVLAVVVWLLAQVQVVVIATVVALMVAGVLTPAVQWLKDRGVSKPLAPLLAFGAVIVVFGLLGLIALLWLIRDWDTIQRGVQRAVDVFVGWGQSAGVPVSEGTAEDVNAAVDQGQASFARTAGGTVLQRAAFLGSLAIGIVMGLGISYRLLRGGDQLWSGLATRLGPTREQVWARIGRQGIVALGEYIWGQTIVAMVDAGLVAGALILMGLSGSLGLVPLVFFAAFVPYVGYILWGTLFVLAAVGSGEPYLGAVALIVVLAVRTADKQVLTRIIGKRVNLNPLEVLYIIALFYYLGGVIAVFLALPAVAAVRAMLDERRRILLLLPDDGDSLHRQGPA
jgi:putative heme transporter